MRHRAGKRPSVSSERGLPSIVLSDEALAAIAERVASLLAERDRVLHPEPWIGVVEAAEHLHCRPQRIYSLVHQGRVSPRREGSRLLFRRSELDQWLLGEPSSHRQGRRRDGIRDGR